MPSPSSLTNVLPFLTISQYLKLNNKNYFVLILTGIHFQNTAHEMKNTEHILKNKRK